MVNTDWGQAQLGRCWSKETKFQPGGIGSGYLLYRTVTVVNNHNNCESPAGVPREQASGVSVPFVEQVMDLRGWEVLPRASCPGSQSWQHGN